jgi:hypothetical protein
MIQLLSLIVRKEGVEKMDLFGKIFMIVGSVVSFYIGIHTVITEEIALKGRGIIRGGRGDIFRDCFYHIGNSIVLSGTGNYRREEVLKCSPENKLSI